MTLLGQLKPYRRRIASALLMWLLFSGQLFCTVHAGFGLEPAVDQSRATCCHGETNRPAAASHCCDNPATFCCGDGKHGASDAVELPRPVAAVIAFVDLIAVTPARTEAQPAPWVAQRYLRRSDPPLHLLNCTFLD